MSDDGLNNFTRAFVVADRNISYHARNRRKVENKRRPPKHKANHKSFSAATLEDLERSGLRPADAANMGIQSMSADDCEERLGLRRAGYTLPYADFDGNLTGFYRYRFTDFFTPQTYGKHAVTIDQPKYIQPKGSRVHLYLPSCTNWRKILGDPKTSIWVTEGEKKAYAMSKAGFPCVGLGGVWNFCNRSEMGDETDAHQGKKNKSSGKENDRMFLPE